MVEIEHLLQSDVTIADIKQSSPNDLTACAILVWHGHWEEAHHFSQANEGELPFDYLHALQHRLEKDYGNANYWHRRSAGMPNADTSQALTEAIATDGWTDELTAAHQAEITAYIKSLPRKTIKRQAFTKKLMVVFDLRNRRAFRPGFDRPRSNARQCL